MAEHNIVALVFLLSILVPSYQSAGCYPFSSEMSLIWINKRQNYPKGGLGREADLNYPVSKL